MTESDKHPVDWVEAMYEIQPEKCRGCECSHIEYDFNKRECVWICELEQIGETCYLEQPSIGSQQLRNLDASSGGTLGDSPNPPHPRHDVKLPTNSKGERTT